MAQPLPLAGERLGLARLDRRSINAGDQLLELVAAPLGRVGVGPRALQRRLRLTQLRPGGGHPCARLAGAGRRVQQFELRLGAGQPPCLVLRRHLQQPLAQRLEIVASTAAPPHHRPAASRRGDPPRHHQRRLVLGPQRNNRLRQAGFEEPVRHRELGLDIGLLCVWPDHAGRRWRARQQPDRLCQHRLAGAGLAGEHVQAAGQLELGVLDQGEVVDLQTQQRHALNVSR